MLTTPSSHRPASPRRMGRRRGERGEEMLVALPGLADVDVTDCSPHSSQLAEGVPQRPGWIRVEPWNALLCGGTGAGTKEGRAAVAARRRAEELQVCTMCTTARVDQQLVLECWQITRNLTQSDTIFVLLYCCLHYSSRRINACLLIVDPKSLCIALQHSIARITAYCVLQQ